MSLPQMLRVETVVFISFRYYAFKLRFLLVCNIWSNFVKTCYRPIVNNHLIQVESFCTLCDAYDCYRLPHITYRIVSM